ncbi:MAG: sigma-70 family RNA polymerase sigma factor [Solirubrobacterales bacterium]
MSKATEIQASPDEAEAGGTFADFFAEGYPRLVRAVLPATRDLGVAEEVAQEAMTRVFARWGRVSRLDSPIGYAYVTALNVHRRRTRRPWAPLTRDIADLSPDPAWQVASRDRLLAALAALPEGERDALLLVSFLGLSTEEAGRALKIKPASVRSRLHRARIALRELKEKEDG